MEESFFRNRPADYVWLLVFSGIALVICAVRKGKSIAEAETFMNFFRAYFHLLTCHFWDPLWHSRWYTFGQGATDTLD